MSETAVLEQPRSGARLVRPREEAIGFIQNQIKKGSEIKALRIRTGQELDQARALKLEWTNQTTELLEQIFDNKSVADECNDWVGKIYPEYAEFGNFVEQFYAEMEHRLKRLKNVIKQVQKLPSETRASAPPAAVAAAPPGNGVAPTPTPAAVPGVMVAPKLTPDLKGLMLLFGLDEASRNAVGEFLDSLDVETQIVDEATCANPTALTEALDATRDASFALILSGEPPQERSFELGFCVGRLGLKRVCVIHPQHAQVQSDSRGLTHVVLDAGGGWQLMLARHLKRAGLGVDLNRLC